MFSGTTLKSSASPWRLGESRPPHQDCRLGSGYTGRPRPRATLGIYPEHLSSAPRPVRTSRQLGWRTPTGILLCWTSKHMCTSKKASISKCVWSMPRWSLECRWVAHPGSTVMHSYTARYKLGPYSVCLRETMNCATCWAGFFYVTLISKRWQTWYWGTQEFIQICSSCNIL
jgi:hypothetical protein